MNLENFLNLNEDKVYYQLNKLVQRELMYKSTILKKNYLTK